MAASRFVQVTDKEISEIKINSVPKNTKDLCKNTKTINRLKAVFQSSYEAPRSSLRVLASN